MCENKRKWMAERRWTDKRNEWLGAALREKWTKLWCQWMSASVRIPLSLGATHTPNSSIREWAMDEFSCSLKGDAVKSGFMVVAKENNSLASMCVWNRLLVVFYNISPLVWLLIYRFVRHFSLLLSEFHLFIPLSEFLFLFIALINFPNPSVLILSLICDL